MLNAARMARAIRRCGHCLTGSPSGVLPGAACDRRAVFPGSIANLPLHRPCRGETGLGTLGAYWGETRWPGSEQVIFQLCEKQQGRGG